jgi:uncharacterized protein YneF (UPF0154 family)
MTTLYIAAALFVGLAVGYWIGMKDHAHNGVPQ